MNTQRKIRSIIICGQGTFKSALPAKFNLLQKLPHDPRAILRRISPQHRTEHLNGFFALPVIRPGADVADVRAELVDDLLDVLQLLRGEVGVIEQPVKFLAVLVLGAHEIHSAVYKAEHFVALLDALCLMLQLRAGEIRAGQIDGFQKILNRFSIQLMNRYSTPLIFLWKSTNPPIST